MRLFDRWFKREPSLKLALPDFLQSPDSSTSASPTAFASGQEEESATQMQLEFAVIEEGKPIIRDTILLTSEPQSRGYKAMTGDTSRSYVAKYVFERPAASFGLVGPAYKAGFAMGVHRSEHWESIGIGTWATLLFKCTPLP